MKTLAFTLFLNIVCIAAFSQDIGYAKRIIQELSSAEFKGRGYVEKGDKISADYISNEFRELGLLPVYENSYFQKFIISINTFPGKVLVKINGKELVTASDYLVEASSPSVKGKFAVIKTTRDQIDSKAKVDALISKAVNSFILIDCRGKKDKKPETSKIIDEFVSFLKYSPGINVKGIIIYTTDKLTWDCSTEQSPRPVLIISKDIDLTTLNSIDITINARLVPEYQTQNIAGYIRGTSGNDSTIVVLAHYDHLGKLGKNTYFPGANDNASGVAMILSLARYYSENKPRNNMVFIALAAEEAGILGAKAFTEYPPVDLKKIKFLINFDLAGTGEEGIKVVNGSVFRSKFDLLSNINQQLGLLPKVEIRGAACNSDHCLFYQKGVPCFYIYTLGGTKAYHDIYDRYETLPLTEFADYYKLIIEFFNKI